MTDDPRTLKDPSTAKAARPGGLRARVRRKTRLGEMFRLYRTVRGLSLRELAPHIGIGHATLMRIESGEMFDAATLLKLWTWMAGDD